MKISLTFAIKQEAKNSALISLLLCCLQIESWTLPITDYKLAKQSTAACKKVSAMWP